MCSRYFRPSYFFTVVVPRLIANIDGGLCFVVASGETAYGD